MSALGCGLVCQLYEQFTKYARDIDYILFTNYHSVNYAVKGSPKFDLWHHSVCESSRDYFNNRYMQATFQAINPANVTSSDNLLTFE